MDRNINNHNETKQNQTESKFMWHTVWCETDVITMRQWKLRMAVQRVMFQ